MRVRTLAGARVRVAWLFLLPALLVLALTAGWPLLRTIWFSLTDARLSNLSSYDIVWLDNYADVLTDPVWWHAVRNTLLFALASVACETVLGLVIALAMDVRLPGRGLLRAAVLVPWAIPTVVSAQMWSWMYNDIYGVIDKVLLALGIIGHPIAWTADPALALWSLVLVDVWKTTPFMALLTLAALQVVPQEIYEAARVDGVSPIMGFFRITLPLIRPALMVAVIFRALDALRIFDIVYVLTGNNEATMSMSVYARQNLVGFQEIGYGSAASTLLFLVIAVMTSLYIVAAQVGQEDSG
jgi:trehalose/maltose transport system permease protein